MNVLSQTFIPFEHTISEVLYFGCWE